MNEATLKRWEEEPVETPREIGFYADFGCGVWDHEGVGIGELEPYFQHHPKIEQIKKIDVDLDQWILWFEECFNNEDQFDWDSFHETGCSLAARFANLISGSAIEVFYRPPFEDPTRGVSDKTVFSKGSQNG